MSSAASESPGTSFHKLLPSAPFPMRADRSALGTLPTAAFQYCEAVTSASAFGWYAFPPMRFYVQFDGAGFVWTHDDAESWFPITSEHFPGFDQIFDALAPSDVRGLAPPFLSTLPQPGFLQIWTGILIRTLPGWSVLVRHPANLPHSRDYEMYEGIVETDRWFYPLFVNVRVTACDRPIRFDPATPLLQVQPLNRATYSESTLRSAVFLDGLESLGDEDWHDYRRILGTRAEDPGMRPGRYAGAVRRRASVGESCTFHSMIEAD